MIRVEKKEGQNTSRTRSHLMDHLSKKSSDTLKEIIKNSGTDIKSLAHHIGIEEQSLRNKFTRNSFTIAEFLVIAGDCGYDVILRPKDKKEVVL